MTAVTVFDAYGTLFDPHGLTERLETAFPGRGPAISVSWRHAQLRYTWLRSLMGRWAPFDVVTADALRWACDVHGVDPDDEMIDAIMGAYRSLPAYPDVGPALEALPGPLAILSNGSHPMLQAACNAAGISDQIQIVLSSDDVSVYKPDPRIYRLVPDRFGVTADEVRFVSGPAGTAPGLLPSASMSSTSHGAPNRRNGWEQGARPQSSICETSSDWKRQHRARAIPTLRSAKNRGARWWSGRRASRVRRKSPTIGDGSLHGRCCPRRNPSPHHARQWCTRAVDLRRVTRR